MTDTTEKNLFDEPDDGPGENPIQEIMGSAEVRADFESWASKACFDLSRHPLWADGHNDYSTATTGLAYEIWCLGAASGVNNKRALPDAPIVDNRRMHCYTYGSTDLKSMQTNSAESVVETMPYRLLRVAGRTVPSETLRDLDDDDYFWHP